LESLETLLMFQRLQVGMRQPDRFEQIRHRPEHQCHVDIPSRNSIFSAIRIPSPQEEAEDPGCFVVLVGFASDLTYGGNLELPANEELLSTDQ
jgi:hypothetical protein